MSEPAERHAPMSPERAERLRAWQESVYELALAESGGQPPATGQATRDGLSVEYFTLLVTP
jgi:hypothetical protein